MKLAVCFLTTDENHFNIKPLEDQVNNSKLHNIDLYIYVDNNCKDYYSVNTVSQNKRYIYFHYNYFRYKFNWKIIYYNELSSTHDKEGTAFLPLLDLYTFWNEGNEYDMFLLIEDDVSYFGKNNLFDSLDFNCDALFQDKRKLIEDDNWYWWYRIPHNIDDNIIKDKYHGLLQIYGLKGNIIKGLIDFIKNGNYAHFELLISAYVLNHNYKVNYINNYMNIYCDWENNIPISDKYDLMHPIKTLEKYQKIKNLHNLK